jgi:hypothetical protein
VDPLVAAARKPCRTIAEVEAAADEDSRDLRPLTQEQSDYTAALLAPHMPEIIAGREAGEAAGPTVVPGHDIDAVVASMPLPGPEDAAQLSAILGFGKPIAEKRAAS